MEKRPITPAMAHYLGEIYRMGGATELISPSSLADLLQVSTAAAVRMLDRLEGNGLVERQPYKGAQLTSAGIRQALREIRFHRLSEAFLVTVMGYRWHEAHDMADALAEVADDRFVDRMSELAGHPTRCPHGEPIPTSEGRMPVVEDLALTEVEPPAQGVISRVKVRDDERLIYLAEIQMTPGRSFKALSKAPFDGPVRLRIDRDEVVIGADLAARIRVIVEGDDQDS